MRKISKSPLHHEKTRFATVCVLFFQAEDGIRDHCVTGVQTCALPISHFTHSCCGSRSLDHRIDLRAVLDCQRRPDQRDGEPTTLGSCARSRGHVQPLLPCAIPSPGTVATLRPWWTP